jgi:hypothetical protein
MDLSLALARQFARLVWLLLHDSGNVDAQKLALRAIVAASRDGAVSFALTQWRVIVDGEPMPEGEPEVQDLAAQMIGHAVREMVVSQGAKPSDVLAVARALASEPVPGSGGRAVTEAVRDLDAPTISAVVDAVVLPPAAAPVDAHIWPRPVRATVRASGSYLAFAAVQPPKGSIAEMLVELSQLQNADEMGHLLESIAIMIEDAAQAGRSDLVADSLCALVAAEEGRTSESQKRALTMALRRLRKPRIIRILAERLPARRDKSDEIMVVLGRMGQDGVDAVIEALIASESAGERRIFFDALIKAARGAAELRIGGAARQAARSRG